MLVEKENITLDESNDLLLEQNIKNCLQDFNFANKVYEKVVELRDESFNSENPQHEVSFWIYFRNSLTKRE